MPKLGPFAIVKVNSAEEMLWFLAKVARSLLAGRKSLLTLFTFAFPPKLTWSRSTQPQTRPWRQSWWCHSWSCQLESDKPKSEKDLVPFFQYIVLTCFDFRGRSNTTIPAHQAESCRRSSDKSKLSYKKAAYKYTRPKWRKRLLIEIGEIQLTKFSAGWL